MHRTHIRFTHDGRYNDYKKGEEGYIDGYVRGGDDIPCAVVVIGARLVLASTLDIEVRPDRQTV